MKRFNLIAGCLLAIAGPWFSPTCSAATRETVSAKSSVVYQNWHDSKRRRDIPIKIYLPTDTSGPQPVVIFSHGLGGSREAAVYLGDCWSQHGYVGVFVQHPGSDAALWQSAAGQGKQAVMQRLNSAANGQNLIDRVGDIDFVIDELQKRSQTDPALKGRMDLSKIAIAGHSFGAGTALAVAGQNFGPKGNVADSRVKAAIYLCPPVGAGKFAPKQTYGDIRIPGLLLTGTEDNSPIGKTSAEERRIPFDGMTAPHQYLVNFIGADHATFGGRSYRQPKDTDATFQEMIDELTTKFLDATLRGDASAWNWLDSGAAKAYLGNTARMEQK